MRIIQVLEEKNLLPACEENIKNIDDIIAEMINNNELDIIEVLDDIANSLFTNDQNRLYLLIGKKNTKHAIEYSAQYDYQSRALYYLLWSCLARISEGQELQNVIDKWLYKRTDIVSRINLSEEEEEEKNQEQLNAQMDHVESQLESYASSENIAPMLNYEDAKALICSYNFEPEWDDEYRSIYWEFEGQVFSIVAYNAESTDEMIWSTQEILDTIKTAID